MQLPSNTQQLTVRQLSTFSSLYKTNKCIHVVLDGAGYHRSEVVRAEAKKLGIELHYLPPTALI